MVRSILIFAVVLVGACGNPGEDDNTQKTQSLTVAPAAGPGKACGASQGCLDGLLCDITANDSCGDLTLPGICTPYKNILCEDEPNLVCGCDGITYTNDCHRLLAAVQRSHDGPCVIIK